MSRKPDPITPIAKQLVAVLDHAAQTHGDEIRSIILQDLAAGRRGWYHEMVLCYIDDSAIEQYGRLAAIQAANQLHLTLPEECFQIH